jgi:hypothetical protein
MFRKLKLIKSRQIHHQSSSHPFPHSHPQEIAYFIGLQRIG